MADVTKTVNVIVKANTSNLQSGLGKGQSGFANFAKYAKLALAGVVAAIAAMTVKFLADVAKIGAQFESTMAEVGAVGRMTAEQLAVVSQKARDIGAATAFSASEAGEGFILLARAGLSAEQQVGAIDATMKLAGATATDLSTATSGVVATLAQFNLGVDQSSRVADVFAAAASGSLFSVEELTTAMRYGGTVAGGLGIDLESATAGLMMFRNLGLEASQAGTTYRQVMLSLTKPTSEMTEGLAKYGLTTEDVNPRLHDFGEIIQTLADRGVDVSQVFDKRAAGAMLALVKNAREGRNEFTQFSDDLNKSAGTADEMYGRMMDTVEGQSKIMKSAIEEVKLAIFDTFSTTLKEGYSDAAGVFQAIGNVIKNNLPLFKQIIAQIKTMFTAVKTGSGDVDVLQLVIRAAGNIIIGVIGAVSIAINQMKMIWWTVKRAFVTVFDIIRLGFASILDQVVGVVNTAAKVAGLFSDKLEEKMKGTVEGIAELSAGIKDKVEDNFLTTFEEGQEVFGGLTESYAAFGGAILSWNSVNLNATERTTEATENLGGAVAGVVEQAQELNTAMTETVENVVPAMTEKLELLKIQSRDIALNFGNITQELPEIQEQTSSWGDLLTDSILDTVGFLENAFTSAFNLIGQGTKDIGKKIMGIFNDLGRSILNMLAKIAAKMAVMGILNLISGGAIGAGIAAGGTLAQSLGAWMGFASGGEVPGSGFGDTVPAMLTPGEFVVRREVAQSPGMMDYLRNLNTSTATTPVNFSLNGLNRSERELYIRDLRPGGALSEAFKHLGGKVVLQGV